MSESNPNIDPVLEAATRAGQSPGGGGLSVNPGGEQGGLPPRVGHDIANRGGEGGDRLPSNAREGTDVDEAGMTGSGGGLGTDAGARGDGGEGGLVTAAGGDAVNQQGPSQAAGQPGAFANDTGGEGASGGHTGLGGAINSGLGPSSGTGGRSHGPGNA